MQNKKSSFSQRGFTLLELLVSISIIAIVASIVLVGLLNQKKHSELRAASSQLASTIRQAQNYALTGKATGPGEKTCRYLVRMENPSTYYLKQVKDVDGNCSTGFGNAANIQIKTLPAGITFTLPLAGVGFRLPRADAEWLNTSTTPNSWGPLASNSVNFGITKGGVTYWLCYYYSGNVIENGTSSACP